MLADRKSNMTQSQMTPKTIQAIKDILTPLSALANPLGLTLLVGPSSPPVPGKLAEKIWNGEYIDFSALLPHSLGAPESTLAEALQRRTRDEKQITSIEQWVDMPASLQLWLPTGYMIC